MRTESYRRLTFLSLALLVFNVTQRDWLASLFSDADYDWKDPFEDAILAGWGVTISGLVLVAALYLWISTRK